MLFFNIKTGDAGNVTLEEPGHRARGRSIRPIKEDMLFGATTGGQQSGGEYTGGDLNPGWGDGN